MDIKNISTGAFSICNLYKKNNKLYAIKIPTENDLDGIIYNELREIFALLILNENSNIITRKITNIFLLVTFRIVIKLDQIFDTSAYITTGFTLIAKNCK